MWLKFKTDRTDDFVIVGYTAPKGGRPHIGALHLADLVGGTLCYAGRVGTGFNDAQLGELKAMLDPIARVDAPCAGPATAPGVAALPVSAIPDTSTTSWVNAECVCEVRFREWTPDGVLRHPTFLRLRNDKRVRDCDRQQWSAPTSSAAAVSAATSATGDTTPAVAASAEPVPVSASRDGAEPPHADAPTPPEKTFAFSNLKKIYWPEERYTKGDFIAYYRSIAPYMLPYLKDRPIVLTRFPDGIDGKSFYQKDAPEFAPSWMRTVPIWSEDTQRDIRYFVCDDVESLLYVANMGSIPIHMWASRVDTLEQPDWCVIDLDPKDAPFSDVVRTALVLHALCDAIGLPHYVKTTGKTGLHILVPLPRGCTYAQSRTLGELLARVVLRELDDIATITRHVTRRGAKVYFDYLQNRHGQTIVAPYSVRPLPGATVSMPLVWEEVNGSLDPKMFTIRNALERMERLRHDPVVAVLGVVPDLHAVLQRLSARL